MFSSEMATAIFGNLLYINFVLIYNIKKTGIKYSKKKMEHFSEI